MLDQCDDDDEEEDLILFYLVETVKAILEHDAKGELSCLERKVGHLWPKLVVNQRVIS